MIRQPFEFPPDPARLVQTVGSLEAARPSGLPRTRAAAGAKRGLDLSRARIGNRLSDPIRPIRLDEAAASPTLLRPMSAVASGRAQSAGRAVRLVWGTRCRGDGRVASDALAVSDRRWCCVAVR
jgi:hypothetical protein